MRSANYQKSNYVVEIVSTFVIFQMVNFRTVEAQMQLMINFRAATRVVATRRDSSIRNGFWGKI